MKTPHKIRGQKWTLVLFLFSFLYGSHTQICGTLCEWVLVKVGTWEFGWRKQWKVVTWDCDGFLLTLICLVKNPERERKSFFFFFYKNFGLDHCSRLLGFAFILFDWCLVEGVDVSGLTFMGFAGFGVCFLGKLMRVKKLRKWFLFFITFLVFNKKY